MTSWVGAGFLVAGFVAIIRATRLAECTGAVFRAGRESMVVMRDQSLSEDDKEKLLQRLSLRLFGLFAAITFAGAAAVAVPAGLIWGASHLGWLNWNEVVSTTLSPPFLAVSTIVGMALYWVLGRVRKDARK